MTQAEELWAFKLAEQDWSFRSCDGIDLLFHGMFQSETSEKIFYLMYEDVLGHSLLTLCSLPDMRMLLFDANFSMYKLITD